MTGSSSTYWRGNLTHLFLCKKCAYPNQYARDAAGLLNHVADVRFCLSRAVDTASLERHFWYSSTKLSIVCALSEACIRRCLLREIRCSEGFTSRHIASRHRWKESGIFQAFAVFSGEICILDSIESHLIKFSNQSFSENRGCLHCGAENARRV